MDLLQSFKKYLDLRQISYSVVDDTIQFDRNGWKLMLFYDSDVPAYFRLALPKIETVDDNFCIEKYKRALSIAADYKVAKAVIINDSLWFVFENFLPDYFFANSKLFDRAIRILVDVGNEWRLAQ